MATKLAQILADFTTSLASELVVGGTTATLSAAVDDDGVALPSGRYFFTLDNSNTSKEHISCDLVGTALTNIKSVSRQGVETTGTVRKHRIGATVTLTDFGSIKFMNDILKGTTQLDVNAPLGYDGAPGTLTGNQLATVTYVLGVVNGGAVTFDQQIISNQTSGEAIAVNDVVYFKEADAKWYKADADLTATFDQLQIGICKTVAGASGVTIQVAISGPVSGFTGLTAGAKYYLSNTAGAITTTAGTNSVFIGWALTSTTLLFNPILKTLPSQKEKDALVGSQGVASSTNKYISQDNVSIAGTDQSQTTQDAFIETGESNATTKRNKVAQSFTAGKTKVRGVALYKTADTGTFTGTVTVSLQADTAGSPSGTALLTKTLTNAEYNALAVGAFDVMFSSEYSSLVLGSTYWIVIETSTADTSNHPNIGTNSAGGYAGGSVKAWNTTDGWTAVATIDLYFKIYEGVKSQVVSTDSSGRIPLGVYDINTMPPQAFYQRINTGSATFGGTLGATSNQDGSILIVLSSDGILLRLTKGIAGNYVITHSVAATSGTASSGMAIVGSYVYRFFDAGANMGCYRHLLSDLTGETLMTVPTIATGGSNDKITAWCDNVYLYIQRPTISTTVYQLSISGTALATVTTGTGYTSFYTTDANGDAAAMTGFFDGTTVYLGSLQTGASFTICKLSNFLGTAGNTSITILSRQSGYTTYKSGYTINIDAYRMYIGVIAAEYNATTNDGYTIELTPITKP